MSAFAMKPVFKDLDGYRAWKASWRTLQKRQTATIRRLRQQAKALQRAGSPDAAKVQRDLVLERVMGAKLMSLLEMAKVRWQKIEGVKRQMEEQFASFPLVFDKCQAVDFHFNKFSLEMPDVPMWVVKAKGKTFYVNHVDAKVPWTTRELADGPTKGMIRLRNCRMEITKEGTAVLSPP